MAYTIEIAERAFDELQAIKTYHRRPIVDAIDRQLVYEPTAETRNARF
jgi:hypothetical protein